MQTGYSVNFLALKYADIGNYIYRRKYYHILMLADGLNKWKIFK